MNKGKLKANTLKLIQRAVSSEVERNNSGRPFCFGILHQPKRPKFQVNGKKGCFKLFGTSFFIGGRYVIIQADSAFTVTDMVMDAGGMKRCLKH